MGYLRNHRSVVCVGRWCCPLASCTGTSVASNAVPLPRTPAHERALYPYMPNNMQAYITRHRTTNVKRVELQVQNTRQYRVTNHNMHHTVHARK